MFKKNHKEPLTEIEMMQDFVLYPSDGIEISDTTVVVFGGFLSEHQVQFYISSGTPYHYYIKTGTILSIRGAYHLEPVKFLVKEYSHDENKLMVTRLN